MNDRESEKRTKPDEQVTETDEKTQSSGLSLMRREALALFGIGGLGVLTSGSAAAQSRGKGSDTSPFYNWQQDINANSHALSELGSLSMSANSTSIQDFAGENLSIKDGVLTAAVGSGQSGSVTDQGPWYDHNVNTTTELKETPIPTSAVEVVSPDGTETAVVAYRDGTQKHVYDGNAYTTIEHSRDGGQSFSKTATIKLSSTIDPCRTGNGLIAVDDTTLYFFDSQVDPRTQSNEATAVHRLDWDSSSKGWNVTTNLNRYKNFRILPHFVENGTIKVGYVDFTVEPSVVRFAEYDPSNQKLTTLGTINGQPIRPNEHILQPRKDGTLVAIVRCEAPNIEGTSPPAEQWSTSEDEGKTWTNHGFIEQTLHPLNDGYGATKGGQMIDTPYGERLVFLYRWSRGDDQETVLGLFNPYNGTVEQNVIISTVDSNEGANGGLRLVEDNEFGWRFYVVHEQGRAFYEGSGSGIFFRDLTLYQPATHLGRYLGGESGSDEESTPSPNPAVAGKRENTWLSVSKAGSQVGGRAYLGSEQDISVDSTEQILVDSVEFVDGIKFDKKNNAFVVQEDGIYDLNAAISYIQTGPDDLVQSRIHLATDVGSINTNNKRSNGYFTSAGDVPLGIAGAVVTTTEKLSKGNAITLFGQYAR
jgi:hypothetical protein